MHNPLINIGPAMAGGLKRDSRRRKAASVESYMHRGAKEVFAGWLRDAARVACGGDDCDGNPWARFGDIAWRVNRNGPHFGVWIEYPFGHAPSKKWPHERDGNDPVWDECRTWISDDEDPLPSPWAYRPPTYDELIRLGKPPEFIADIAIQHKGHIKHVIEVVHKNPTTDHKIDEYWAMNVYPIVIPSNWIMSQVATPNYLPREFWRPSYPHDLRRTEAWG